MNFFDFILVVIVVWNVAGGFMAGLAKVGLNFVATILGIFFGFWFYYIPAAWIKDYIRSDTASNLLGFFIVFAAFVIAGTIVGRILSKMLKVVGLSFLDRLGGAAFGFARGAVVVVALVTVVTAFSPHPPPRFIVESSVMPYASTAARIMSWLAPRSLTDAYRQSLDKLHNIWNDKKRGALKDTTL